MSIENLSMGGAFIRSSSSLPVGSSVAIDLVKPGLKKAIRLTGQVVSALSHDEALASRRVPGMGIKFDPYPSEVEERLHELLIAIAEGDAALEGDPSEAPVALDHAESNAPAPTVGADAVAVPESARLMVQVTGLMMELGDWQMRVQALERENEALRREVDALRAELAKTRRDV